MPYAICSCLLNHPHSCPISVFQLLCFMSLRAETCLLAAVSPEPYNVTVVDPCLFADVKQKPVTEVSTNHISRKHQGNLEMSLLNQ